jgi:hypothetical protein
MERHPDAKWLRGAVPSYLEAAMKVMYLCLTCLNVSAEACECHNRPMIRCGVDEPSRPGTSPQLGTHPHANHWLINTLRMLKQAPDNLPKN